MRAFFLPQLRFILLALFSLSAAAPVAAHDLIFTAGFQPVPDAPASDAAAARFLTMATFGPTPASIAQLRSVGYSQWIEQQLSLPTTLEEPGVEALDAGVQNPGPNDRMQAWWNNSITANDQLRQRMAWALSQIMVISDGLSHLRGDPIAVAGYYDILARDAGGYYSNAVYHTGNYYNLLYDVTKSPAMAKMLTYIRNIKPEPLQNLSPDENYAREVMQLFSIGLTLRNPDFSQVLNAGEPIPTYTQAAVTAYAQVFTGWSYASGFYGNPAGQHWLPADYQPLSCYDTYHDESDAKVLLSYNPADTVTFPYYQLPPNNGCELDLEQGLSVIANHPNVAPFISRELIQRLVTSNPSACYIKNVSTVFTATQGDLGAVIKAVLLDPEALNGVQDAPCADPNFVFGKLREPLLKLTAFWRYYDASAASAKFNFPHPEDNYAQRPLGAPSVFNFYLPDYLPPGELGQGAHFAPELQIMNESTVVATSNDLAGRAFAYVGNPKNNQNTVAVELSALIAAPTSVDLVNALNHDLFYGRMSATMQVALVAMLNGVPSASGINRVQLALQVVLASPEFAVQR